MSEYESRLQLALTAAAEASELIMSHYQTGVAVESKSDASPVTVADKGAEEILRKHIGSAFPEDGILGEEYDDVPSKNGFNWILDPIDGTKPFIAGVPLFGTLIGIQKDDRMVAGVCRFPALDEVMYAAEGSGAWWKKRDAEPVAAKVVECSSLSNARVMFTEPSSWRDLECAPTMDGILKAARQCRGWGDCYGHMLVATGRADVSIDPIMSPWDIAALIPIVREAGGVCTDWTGTETAFGGAGVSLSPGLEDEVLAILKPAAGKNQR